MRRQLPPTHLKVPPGSHGFPAPRHLFGESTVVVNYYSGFEKAIPTIPSLPGFRTSAGMFIFRFGGWCRVIAYQRRNLVFILPSFQDLKGSGEVELLTAFSSIFDVSEREPTNRPRSSFAIRHTNHLPAQLPAPSAPTHLSLFLDPARATQRLSFSRRNLNHVVNRAIRNGQAAYR